MRRPTPQRYAVPCGLQTQYGLTLVAQSGKEDRPVNNGSKGAAEMTVGLDLGDKYSCLCLLDDESGESSIRERQWSEVPRS